MTFKYKLSRRLAILFGVAVAAIYACELPIATTPPAETIAQLIISPKAVAVQPNQDADLMAVGLTTAGDTADISVTWSATAGSVTDAGTDHGRHYGRFRNGNCGSFKVAATSNPGAKSDTANVTVTCSVPVATVDVTPASATVSVGQTVQLTATPKDASGNALSGRTVTWASSNTSVATVNGSGLVTGKAGGAATITATSEGQSNSAGITVTAVPVASVAVTPGSATVEAGKTVQLTATPRDASGNALSGRAVNWVSSNPAVATVSGSGLVTGQTAGAATITATSEGQSGSAGITVTAPPPPPVGCSASSLAWQNGVFTSQSGSFTALYDATPNGTSIDGVTGLSAGAAAGYADLAVIVRFNTTGQIDARNGGTYTATNPIPYTAGTSYRFRLVVDIPTHTYAAYVTPAGGSELTLGVGYAFRTEQSSVATLGNWAVYSDVGTHTVCNFSITGVTPPVPVASVTLTPASAAVNVGQTVQLAATLKDANGNVLSGRAVTWSSSNTTVATVSGSGLVTGKVAGTATITATSEGQSGTSAITVNAPPPPAPVASVTITPATASLNAGQTVQLAATLKDASGNVLTGRTVTWSSSNTTVATVSGSGLVTGQTAGTATITATSEGQSGTSAITVNAPPPPAPVASVTVAPATANVNETKTVQLTATLKDASGNVLTGRTVTWSSSNTAVATVSGSGLVTGKVAGTATITATSEGQSGTAAITVVHVPVATVTVAPATASVQAGSTVQLTATPKDASGTALTGRTVTWSSSNTSVATVNGSGLVSGVVAGSATITATSEGQSGSSAITVTSPPPPGTGVVLVGAGDISDCGNNNDEATAKLLDAIPGTVFTLGDNVYSSGTDTQYSQCFNPTWGRHKARTKPSPGNHDYNTSGASGYYNYWGALAGPSSRGYYSYDLGDWHIISLNSEVSVSAGSAQEQWLRADLAASTKKCTLAYWHKPRFSSGTHGSSTTYTPLWQALYDFNADLVLTGHDHNYQRFAPQTPGGVADPARGIREFVVGTGGESHYNFSTPIANTEAYNNSTYGVLKLTLNASSYTWEFIPVAGQNYRDSGTGSCH